MAQNITLMGASYSGVPGVNLPKTGGGQAYFVDSSDANAVASDIATGKTAYVNGTKVTGTNSGGGGGGGSVEPKQINFIDYDGTILYAYTKAEINAMTSESDLPANPSHTGLTAQGWNWTLAQIKAQLTAIPNGNVWVGQMYVTSSGDTEIDVSMPTGRLSPILNIAVDGTITVDWGDNTAADTVTGYSLITRKDVAHVYTSAGEYTITIHVSSGSFTFYGTSQILLLRKEDVANTSIVYTNSIREIRIGNGITQLGDYSFYDCTSLKTISIPQTVTVFGTNLFNSCYSLDAVVIPKGVNTLSGYDFANCYFRYISIPSGLTTINANAFSYSRATSSITLPNGITSIGATSFQYCYGMTSITIPSTVTSIGGTAFQYSYGVSEFHILPTTVPSLGSNAFRGIASDCVIYVPSAKLNDYKTASNWSTYASKMVGE